MQKYIFFMVCFKLIFYLSIDSYYVRKSFISIRRLRFLLSYAMSFVQCGFARDTLVSYSSRSPIAASRANSLRSNSALGCRARALRPDGPFAMVTLQTHAARNELPIINKINLVYSICKSSAIIYYNTLICLRRL